MRLSFDLQSEALRPMLLATLSKPEMPIQIILGAGHFAYKLLSLPPSIQYLRMNKLRRTLVLRIKSNLLVKYNGTVRRLKPSQIKIEGAWESKKGRGQGEPCKVQESLESVKRGRIDYFSREFIPRDGKSHREGCFPPE